MLTQNTGEKVNLSSVWTLQDTLFVQVCKVRHIHWDYVCAYA